jgi:hypothetical protein
MVYVEENFEECSIKSLDDIPDKIVEGVLTDSISELMMLNRATNNYDGVLIDDLFNKISFDFYGEAITDLVKKCVEQALQDIDYEPKFKQLLELSDNLVTGYFGNEQTAFDGLRFSLYSQTATIKVVFNPAVYNWKVRVYEEDSGIETIKSGNGWNELVDYLCVESDLTWFINMSKEQIELCKLYKRL